MTNVGAYTLADSPYGTFDQGGNVWEWTEAIVKGLLRGRRGGSFFVEHAGHLAASSPAGLGPSFEYANVGFRVVTIPRQVPMPSR